MDDILTPADQFNLTILHNFQDAISSELVASYGPDEDEIPNAFKCPYVIGKMYVALKPLCLIRIGLSIHLNPILLAEDYAVETDQILIFLGLERYNISKTNIDDSFFIYTCKFLSGDSACHQLIPTRFNYNGFDWTGSTNIQVQHALYKVNCDQLKKL
jgi:hypothetical protein